MNEQYMHIALTLARLYGIAETLEPWEYLANDDFLSTINEWTKEFLCAQDSDILSFFEAKAAEKTKAEHPYIDTLPLNRHLTE